MPYRDGLFGKHHVRKTRAQKTAFIKYAREYAGERGYSVTVSEKGWGARNIVIGDVSRARVVYTAHYDTQPVLPFPNFITPKNVFIYILYQLLVTLALFIVPVAAALLLPLIIPGELGAEISLAAFAVIAYSEIGLMMFGPANRHTANDNTSGVATVFAIMEKLRGRGDVAFVLFDMEELGLIGSSAFASKNRALMKDRLLVNFDCVSDGKNMMFLVKKGARGYMDQIKEAFAPTDEIKTLYETGGVIYPSDQAAFPVAVGVCSLNKTRCGIYYTDKIHTPRDTVFDAGNIEYLACGAVMLADILSGGTVEGFSASDEN